MLPTSAGKITFFAIASTVTVLGTAARNARAQPVQGGFSTGPQTWQRAPAEAPYSAPAPSTSVNRRASRSQPPRSDEKRTRIHTDWTDFESV